MSALGEWEPDVDETTGEPLEDEGHEETPVAEPPPLYYGSVEEFVGDELGAHTPPPEGLFPDVRAAAFPGPGTES